MDQATAALNHILRSGEYVKVPDVVLFDAHDEFDDAGNLVRRFGRSELEEICRRCNRRAEETGDLSPGGPGHTIPGAPETAQPTPWLYYHNWRVAPFGPAGKLGIIADQYVKRRVPVTLHDGNVVYRDGPTEVATYPRRSVELWVKDKVIDWVALLRRTPQRDLGLLTYQKGATMPAAAPRGRYYGSPSRERPIAAQLRGGKLYYAMEANVPLDPTAAPDAQDPDLEFDNKVMRCIKHNFPSLERLHGEHVARYEAEDADQLAGDPSAIPGTQDAGDPALPNMGAGDDAGMDGLDAGIDLDAGTGMEDQGDVVRNDAGGGMASPAAMPGGNNTFIPGGQPDDDKEPIRMSKPTDPVRYAKKLEQENAALKKQNAAFRQQASAAQAQACVQALVHEGFALDAKKELLKFSKLDQAGRVERMAEIRANYRRSSISDSPSESPVLNFDVPGLPGDRTEPNRYSRETVARAVQVASEKGITYEDALRQVCS